VPSPRPSPALWKTARLETILSYAAAAALLAAAVVVLGDEVGRHVDRVEGWIDGLGASAPLVYGVLYALLSSVFVPETLLGIVAGASFGFARGLAVVVAGNFGGTLVQYVLSRHLLKPSIDRFVASRPALAAIQAAVRRRQLHLQVLLRLSPLNRPMTSYMLGAGGAHFPPFAVAYLAILPYLALEVYFGAAGTELARLRQPGHAMMLRHVVLLAGLAASIVVMTIVARLAREAVDAETQ
jgi:uncharacterized membrane protein YdjX (TVP38/TMEM64 family)